MRGGDVKMFSKYKKENRRQLRRGSRGVLTAEAAEWNPIICTVHTPSLQLYVSVCVCEATRQLGKWPRAGSLSGQAGIEQSRESRVETETQTETEAETAAAS